MSTSSNSILSRGWFRACEISGCFIKLIKIALNHTLGARAPAYEKGTLSLRQMHHQAKHPIRVCGIVCFQLTITLSRSAKYASEKHKSALCTCIMIMWSILYYMQRAVCRDTHSDQRVDGNAILKCISHNLRTPFIMCAS